MEKSIDLILHAARSGEENMALDREALERAEAGEASLRIYRWDRPTVSLGRSQSPEEVAGIFPDLPTVFRPTGGGAVLHGFDLTVAFAVPLPMLGVAPRAVRETYRRMVAPLAAALTACGLPCALAEELATGSSADCFASSGRMDLLHRRSGRKVAGCALAATRGAALLQASVPIAKPPSWLPIAPEVAERYTNPVWIGSRLDQGLGAALRSAGFAVRLVELDPELPPATRASAVLWQISAPVGVSSRLEEVGRYDELAQTLASVKAERRMEAVLAGAKKRTPLAGSIDATEFWALTRGIVKRR